MTFHSLPQSSEITKDSFVVLMIAHKDFALVVIVAQIGQVFHPFHVFGSIFKVVARFGNEPAIEGNFMELDLFAMAWSNGMELIAYGWNRCRLTSRPSQLNS